MTPELQAAIVCRLIDTGKADEPFAFIVLAALEGESALEAFLDKKRGVEIPQQRETAKGVAVEPPGAYVGSITVEGFRGVGPSATLTLRPGPGLTLVVGRNGSGKSSFAEGLEFLLTGRNYRWEKRPKVWLEGWRNLHHNRARLEAELLIEEQGAITVAREWKGTDFTANQVKCVRADKKACSLDALGWTEALVAFRPFLSYNELGSLLEEGPSKLYDALSKVLGLDDLVAVQNLLVNARKTRQAVVDEADQGAEDIREALGIVQGTPDDRVEKVGKALKGKSWDLTTLEKLAVGEESPEESRIEVLRKLEALDVIDEHAIAATVKALRSAARALADLAGTDAERSRQRATLLEQALSFHENHKAKDCPVCRAPGVLSKQWAQTTRAEIAKLRHEAAACEAAVSTVKSRLREAQRYLGAPPALLAQAKDVGVGGLPEARRLWMEWSAGRDLDDPAALADHMENRVLELAEAVRSVKENASVERARLEDVWRPVASAVAAWLPTARQAMEAKDTIKQIKAAEDWWKDTSGLVRDERFAPIAERARAVWNQLRLQSNVDLGGVVLEGTAQRRRVTLQVTVDGEPAEALGVMSQGELHSLALSLFLPRATLPESPFRFICIDDPVQSMDPARVEGLARTLADAAKTRQVIVFTHDDRLPEAVRRLGIPASVHTVTRRARSVVEVRPTLDPVTSLIEDARAVAKTEDLPADVAHRVVPGFCRSAVEAACMESVRRRRLRRGETHEAVEELLAANAKIHPLIALALFDDESRTNDVMPKLRKIGSWAIEAFEICKMGAHERHEGDLKVLIDDSRRLAEHLQKMG